MPLRADTRAGSVAQIWEDLKERHRDLQRQFRCSEITEAVFRAKLYGLGFRNREIDTEVREARGA